MWSVCVRSGGLLLRRVPAAQVAAAGDGRAGLRRDAVLLRGGADAERLRRLAGGLEGEDVCAAKVLLSVSA